MTNQGLWGALVQFWTIEEKPRLTRRNSWFYDHRLTEPQLKLFGILFFIFLFIVATIVVLMGAMV